MEIQSTIFKVADKWHGELIEFHDDGRVGRVHVLVESSRVICWLKVQWTKLKWEFTCYEP